MGLVSGIRDPEKPIPDPDPGVKNAWDPGSGSATLKKRVSLGTGTSSSKSMATAGRSSKSSHSEQTSLGGRLFMRRLLRSGVTRTSFRPSEVTLWNKKKKRAFLRLGTFWIGSRHSTTFPQNNGSGLAAVQFLQFRTSWQVKMKSKLIRGTGTGTGTLPF
jgi:hypothetical protein